MGRNPHVAKCGFRELNLGASGGQKPDVPAGTLLLMVDHGLMTLEDAIAAYAAENVKFDPLG
jgi:hypothetical protein